MRFAHGPFRHGLLVSATLASGALAQDWTPMNPATVPTVRTGQVMAFDLSRQQILMFGGAKDGTASGGLNDTWTWDGTNWTQKSPVTVPPTRAHAAISFDLARGVVVMFGGRIHSGPAGPTGVQNDTWEWDGTNWTQIAATNPPAPRYSATMAYDIARGVHVLFSGVNGSNVSFDETWEYNGTSKAWTQKAPAHSPGGRVYAGMAYDQSRSRSVLYGGADDAFVIRPDVFWEYDGTDWTAVTPAAMPGPTQGHVQYYDSTRKRVVVQGGQTTGRGYKIGTWEYDGVHCYAYTNEQSAAPGSWLAFAAHDWVRGRGVVFGGYQNNLRASTTTERDPTKPGYATFGIGCPGTTGLIEVRPTSPPALGSTFTLDVRNLPSSGAGFVAVALGFSNTSWSSLPLPFDLAVIGLPGCNLYTGIDVSTPVTNNAGTATWSVAVPNDLSLSGLAFYNQALMSNGGAFSVSNAGAGLLR
jgi:hypothetical protein